MMDPRISLPLMMAEVLPLETLVQFLKDAIQIWENDPTEQNLKMVEVHCALIMGKSMTAKDGFDKTLDRLQQMSKVKEFMKNDPLNTKMES